MKLHRRIARYLWIASASLVILLAVVVSLARVLLPYLDDYRATIEARVSAYLGQPVAIEQLDARLLGLTPSIILGEVTLKSATDGQPIAHFDEIRIGLDLYSSLRTRSLMFSELMVAGAQIVVVRRADGSFSVEGMVAMPKLDETPAQPSALGTWLLAQGVLAVRDSTLEWRDEMHKRSLRFNHVAIELVNSGDRHRLNGSVVLPEDGGKELRIAIDVHGNPLEGMEWGGDVYAKAEALRPLYWLPLIDANVPELPFKSGEFTAEVWSEWEQGVAVRSEGHLLVRDARLQSPQLVPVTMRELSGEWLWQRQEEGWDLDLQQLHLQIGDDTKGKSRIHLAHRNNSDLLLADRLILDDLASVAMHAPLLADDQVGLIQSLAPRGEVRRLRLERQDGGMFSSQGEFDELGMNAWESLPGFDGATGRWRADAQGGEIFLDSDAVQFDAPRLFRAPLQIDRLSAVLSFRPMEAGWRLEGRSISASNVDIVSRGELDMQFETGRKPYLDLRFEFWNGQAKRVPLYVPARIMGEGVVGWLDGAFEDGIVRSGTVLFHGRTVDFPFIAQQGMFETRFQAEDVGLAFHREWPRLGKISGEVLFENQGLVITPRSGTLFSTAIEQALVSIDDLKSPVLDVAITASPPAFDVLRLLRETPLAKHMGDALGGMTAAGQSDLRLKLRVPLSEAAAEKTPLHYEGAITLHDARLQVWKGVTFRQMNGTVTFNDTDFHATALQGELFDAPVTLEIKTDDAARTLVTGRGRLKADSVRRYVQLPLLEYLEGESDWRGLLYLPRGEGTHPSMEFHSSLAGMTLQLPAPVGKQREETVPLSVRMAFGTEDAKRVSMNYGERVSARFAFTGEETSLQRAAVHFGPGATELPKEGLRISGVLENLDWSRWHNLLPSGSGDAARLPLVIEMDRLSLVPMSEAGTSSGSLRPENFPQLDVRIRDFSYDDWRLGELTGTSRSDRQYWEMPDLHFVGPHHDIRLSARWREGLRSKLEYSATSDNVEEMLRAFGFASMFARGKGSIKGNLEWDGLLSDISWGAVQGGLAVEVKQGALVEVDPGAGRLFGLLSLQALPRRLSLDFRDLFSKGMQFDEIKGDIRISGGDAQTNNLYIKSPSAGILVEGRTGLMRRDYDHVISVVPNVSESVSIASAIAWGPQVAAAVLLAQNVFKKDIAKATTIRYSVKGSWDDPQFERME